MEQVVNEASPGNVCPRCGAVFSCGMRAGEDVCWCVAFPPAFAVPAAETVPDTGACYCPACLAELVAAKERAAAG